MLNWVLHHSTPAIICRFSRILEFICTLGLFFFSSLWNWAYFFFPLQKYSCHNVTWWAAALWTQTGRNSSWTAAAAKVWAHSLLHSVHFSEWCQFRTCNSCFNATSSSQPSSFLKLKWGISTISEFIYKDFPLTLTVVLKPSSLLLLTCVYLDLSGTC